MLFVLVLIASSAISVGCGGGPASPTSLPSLTFSPTPSGSSVTWASLPPLSEEAKKFVSEKNINIFNGLARWERGPTNKPIRIYADPEIPADAVAYATKHFSDLNKVSFEIVVSKDVAEIVADFNAPASISDKCGEGGMIVDKARVAYRGEIHLVKSCASLAYSQVMTHELGHVLGIYGHTEPGQDFMSPTGLPLKMSDLLGEIFVWIYSVPTGVRPTG
jgi:hypothetical protein